MKKAKEKSSYFRHMLTNENKKSFVEWMYEEKQILTQKNVVFATDAFFMNSAMRWIILNEREGKLSKKEVTMYVEALRNYVEKELDLCWYDGKICIKLNNKKGPQRIQELKFTSAQIKKQKEKDGS